MEIYSPPACDVCGDRAFYWTGIRYVCWDHYTVSDYMDIVHYYPGHPIQRKAAWGENVIFVDAVSFDEGEG